jgi:hypothetical protein
LTMTVAPSAASCAAPAMPMPAGGAGDEGTFVGELEIHASSFHAHSTRFAS